MRNLSLQWKMTVSMVALAILCTVMAQALSVWLLAKSYEESIEKELQATATTFITLGVSTFRGLKKFKDIDEFTEEALEMEDSPQVIHVFARQGRPIFGSPPRAWPEFIQIFQPVEKPTFKMAVLRRQKFMILTTPYQTRGGRNYFLQIARPYPGYGDILDEILWQGAVLLGFLTLLATVAANILARRMIAPVKTIATYLGGLDPSEKEWRPLAIPKAGEYLNAIVSGINDLTLKIKGTLYSMSRLSRYLAHELRTPLTILSGEAQTALSKKEMTVQDGRDVLQSSLEEIKRMESVIGTVSRLFRGAQAVYHPVPLGLGSWISEQIPLWKKQHAQEIIWSPPDSEIIAVVDAELLFRLLDNLIRNVRKHARGSAATIAVFKKESGIRLTVEDAGPGMPYDLLAALNSRLGYYDKAGIGLSLVMEMAGICGFKILFENKKEGGLKVTLSL